MAQSNGPTPFLECLGNRHVAPYHCLDHITRQTSSSHPCRQQARVRQQAPAVGSGFTCRIPAWSGFRARAQARSAEVLKKTVSYFSLPGLETACGFQSFDHGRRRLDSWHHGVGRRVGGSASERTRQLPWRVCCEHAEHHSPTDSCDHDEDASYGESEQWSSQQIPHGIPHATPGEKDKGSSQASGPESIALMSTSTGRLSEGLLPAILVFVLILVSLLTIDAYIWKVIRRPLASFFLTLPFLLSTALTGYLGVVFVPILRRIKAGQIVRKEGPQGHMSKAGTPTMGGLFFIPIGLLVARFAAGYPAPELQGVVTATLAMGAIGLLDDGLILARKHNDGLPGVVKLMLQVIVGLWFFTWLDAAPLPSPYKYKLLVCLPPPLAWWYGGPLYLPLTAFTFAAMSNGVNLTDGLDGLAAGTCAAAFVGMAVATMAVYPTLGIFGASMAGACVGFLAHNRHKADVFMGDTGSLALGGALAAMAATTGMFLPLFLASLVFVVETLSVVAQVGYFKLTKRLYGSGRRLLRMAPLHHHLELTGQSEAAIVAMAYVAAFGLAVAAAYVGLISA